MSSVAKFEPVSPVAEGATLLAVISRAASDETVNVDKMERLMSMYQAIEAKRAEAEFSAALSEMQSSLPAIGERGNAAGRYTYALWEDINTAVKPVLQKFGFALSFRTDFTDGIAVTAVLSHRSGHSERTTIKLPADPSGNKNAVQAVASSVSYGKRYSAGALLNLTSHGEDDDAYATAVECINEEQQNTLAELIQTSGADKAKFLAWLKVGTLAEVSTKKYPDALAQLRKRAAK